MKQGDKVKIHYTGTLNDGTVFDSSEGREPLEFVFGEGQVIPGFEKGVEGMKLHQEKTIKIPSSEAYGEVNEELVREVPRSMFPPTAEIKVGQHLVLKAPTGEQYQVNIKSMTKETVTLDMNHPLAGKELNFKIKLVEIDQGE